MTNSTDSEKGGHTIGPWVQSRAGHSNRLFIRDSRNPSARAIATVHARIDQEANARLIAAAPELLEALKDIREWCLNAKKTTGVEPYGLKVAEAALARATGERE